MGTLGDNLKKYRLKYDMTQEEVAEQINKSKGTYSRYETGTLMPDVETLIKLADIFQQPLDLLVGRVSTVEDWLLRIVPLVGLGDAIGAAIIRSNRKRATKRKKKAATSGDGAKSGS